jgi:hypothetical protein
MTKASDTKIIDSGVIHLGLSDHSSVYICRKIGIPRAEQKIVETRQFKYFNSSAFQYDLGPVHMIPLTGTSRLPRRIFPCVHMEYFVPLAEMKLHCSSIISVCKTSTFQSSNTNT